MQTLLGIACMHHHQTNLDLQSYRITSGSNYWKWVDNLTAGIFRAYRKAVNGNEIEAGNGTMKQK